MLDEWGNLSKTNKFKSQGARANDGVSTSEARKIIADKLCITDYSEGVFNFHNSTKSNVKKL
jgi:hypothetical protein